MATKVKLNRPVIHDKKFVPAGETIEIEDKEVARVTADGHATALNKKGKPVDGETPAGAAA